jgi:hypothetical protein
MAAQLQPGVLTYRRDALIFGLLALIVGGAMAAVIRHPGYTDAYYYFNAGQRLAQGNGLTDAAIWTYIGAPAGLPIPSHLYWMPLASLVAAGGLCSAARPSTRRKSPVCAAVRRPGAGRFRLGRRSAIAADGVAGRVLTLFSGLLCLLDDNRYVRAVRLVGALCLVTLAGPPSGNWRWFT